MTYRPGILLLIVPLLLLASHTRSASADTVPFALIVEEELIFNWQQEEAPYIRYTVLNPGGNEGDGFLFPTIAFAVSLPELPEPGAGFVFTTRPTWNQIILDKIGWDGQDPDLGNTNDGFAFGALPESGNEIPGRPGFTTDQFGSFEENFGDDFGDIQFAQVAFYFDNDGTQNAIAPGEIDSGFFFEHPYLVGTASSTLAIVTNGSAPNAGAQAVGGGTSPPGTISAIPLPSAAWMGLGLLGIMAAARRRRRRG